MFSYLALGTVPVSPQRMGTCAMTPVNNAFNASALAMCTSSTITHTTPSINSSMVHCASPLLVFFNRMFKDCQVQMVCCLKYSFLSPKYTPTSNPMLT